MFKILEFKRCELRCGGKFIDVYAVLLCAIKNGKRFQVLISCDDYKLWEVGDVVHQVFYPTDEGGFPFVATLW